MISFLRGTVINKSLNYAIIEVAGLGYQVYGTENFLAEIKINSPVETYTHHQLREDASDLYGFKTLADLELFELLLTVSGVGPKSALGVLAIATTDDIKEAIIRGDANLLTKVSGIGQKTAERLVLELKNKVIRSTGAATLINSTLVGNDELDALMSLGYSLAEARTALNLVEASLTNSADRVREALKKMVKK
ncbi:MAG: Holliday junction branch migration protein RuvA [Patescibacteria group bacterium]